MTWGRMFRRAYIQFLQAVPLLSVVGFVAPHHGIGRTDAGDPCVFTTRESISLLKTCRIDHRSSPFTVIAGLMFLLLGWNPRALNAQSSLRGQKLAPTTDSVRRLAAMPSAPAGAPPPNASGPGLKIIPT